MAKKKATTKPPAKRKAPPKKAAARADAQPAAAGRQVLVVNIVPRSLSRETNQDSEPTLAVNPANPQQMAATAFTPDPMGGPSAPIYLSTDGGTTWRLNAIVPSVAGSALGTHDISAAFASAGGHLYAGILRDSSEKFESLRTAAFADPTPMTVLGSRANN